MGFLSIAKFFTKDRMWCEWCGHPISKSLTITNEVAHVVYEYHERYKFLPDEWDGYYHTSVCLDELWKFICDASDWMG